MIAEDNLGGRLEYVPREDCPKSEAEEWGRLKRPMNHQTKRRRWLIFGGVATVALLRTGTAIALGASWHVGLLQR